MEVLNYKGINNEFFLTFGEQLKHWHWFDKGTVFSVIKLV